MSKDSLYGVKFSEQQNLALQRDLKSPRWDLDPPQRENYYNDTEYAFALRDYANRLIAANPQ
jgi:hypothetical protein